MCVRCLSVADRMELNMVTLLGISPAIGSPPKKYFSIMLWIEVPRRDACADTLLASCSPTRARHSASNRFFSGLAPRTVVMDG